MRGHGPGRRARPAGSRGGGGEAAQGTEAERPPRAGSADARDRCQQAEREADIDALQVVLAGSDHRDLLLAVRDPPHQRNRYLGTTGKVCARDGLRIGEQLLIRTVVQDELDFLGTQAKNTPSRNTCQ